MKRNMPIIRKEGIRRPPGHPVTGPQLLQRLRAALSREFGSEPTLEQLGNVFGQPRTTIQDWFQSDHRHIRFFLRLLEQLPEPRRLELLAEFCRDLPLLTHPKLEHDPIAVTKLEALIRLRSGFTLISGGTDYQRTFVLTSLGHAFIRANGWSSHVAGLDLHEPMKFVPVPGVVYAGEMLPTARLQKYANQVWPGIASSNAGLLLLNGIWTTVPDLRSDIVKLAADCHVILAEAAPPEPSEVARVSGRTQNLITVISSNSNPAWIQVEVATI